MTADRLCEIIIDVVTEALKPIFESDIIYYDDDGTPVTWADIFNDD